MLIPLSISLQRGVVNVFKAEKCSHWSICVLLLLYFFLVTSEVACCLMGKIVNQVLTHMYYHLSAETTVLICL